jgi:hypothetical protein
MSPETSHELRPWLIAVGLRNVNRIAAAQVIDKRLLTGFRLSLPEIVDSSFGTAYDQRQHARWTGVQSLADALEISGRTRALRDDRCFGWVHSQVASALADVLAVFADATQQGRYQEHGRPWNMLNLFHIAAETSQPFRDSYDGDQTRLQPYLATVSEYVGRPVDTRMVSGLAIPEIADLPWVPALLRWGQ